MKSPEERIETRYVRHLKKENAKLKRENSALRKKNNRLESECFFEEYQDEKNESSDSKDTKKEKNTCPKCNSNGVSKFTAGAIELWVCGDCDARGRCK